MTVVGKAGYLANVIPGMPQHFGGVFVSAFKRKGDYCTQTLAARDGSFSLEIPPTCFEEDESVYLKAGGLNTCVTVPFVSGSRPSVELYGRRAPCPQPTARPLSDAIFLYDNFDNSLYDGSFNRNLWSSSIPTPSKIEQQAGVLIVAGKSAGNTELMAVRYNRVRLSAPTFLEGKVKLGSEDRGGNAHIAIRSDDPSWFSQCGIAGGSASANAFCNDLSWPPKEGHSYDADSVVVQYDEWHTFRIEVQPATMTFTYYIDGKQAGSHVPVDSAKLDRLTLLIGVHGYVTGYFDEIRIGSLPP